ncbi:MAG: aminotransferase class I/II-fold pyridoxal phosphate-dependent enzyme [Archangium sp.]|nr:aminotransferase class I/II-fold pyridoxal phosphate-dependent enzyme [Archangium sp.]
MSSFESARVAGFGTSVFSEMSRLAVQHGAVNLGQGFPDFDGPPEIARAAIEAITGGTNQYAVGQGNPVLRAAIAAHAKRFYGQTIDPTTEVGITCGATEAIFAAVQAFTSPGDEVVLFEPFYDSYLASVQMAQAVPRFVRLRQPDEMHESWWFDSSELAAAFSSKTKLVIVNTPHNPTGKLYTREELTEIGALAKKHGAILLSDEVYEHLVFDDAKHLRPATLPGFSDFTLSVSSGGKSFSFTGWKIGWHLGRKELVTAVQKAHQWITFCSASPFQAAIAKALELPDSYFSGFVESYTQKRDFLSAVLTETGFDVLPCDGTYFLMARTDKHRRETEDDVAFCKRLLIDHGVASIPPSVFYSPEHASEVRGLVRFAFCKTVPVLEAAAARLLKL